MGGTACSSQGLCTSTFWGKTQPAMAFCQHRSPAAAKLLGPWDSPGWAKYYYPTVIPELFVHKKCSSKSLYGGRFVFRLSFCPSNPLPYLKTSPAMPCVTSGYIDRDSGQKTNRRDVHQGSSLQGGEEHSQKSTAQVMPEDEYFLQRHEKKNYQVANHSCI